MKKRTTGFLSLVIGLLLIPVQCFSQNIEKFGTREMLTINGGMSFNSIAYFGENTNGRDPFTWVATGNLTFTIMDVSMPFSYTYTNRRFIFSQPFNQFSLNPSYKWIKTKIGYTSGNFSNYSYSGHLFLGSEIELTPGKWSITMMGGRLNNTIEYDPVADNVNQISYKRIGYGLKTGYTTEKYSAGLIFWKGKDDKNSLKYIPGNTVIKPQDNLVLTLTGKLKLSRSFSIHGEYATSVVTENLLDEMEIDSELKYKFLKEMIVINNSTRNYSAYNFSFSYNLKQTGFEFKYEHIDPGYKTLGSYFMNNDLENFTLASKFSVLQQKLNIQLNSGVQKNNLDQMKASSTTRVIGNLNISFQATKSFRLNCTYSNFNTVTKNSLQSDPFLNFRDTMNFYQVTQNSSMNLIYQKSTDKLNRNFQVMFNYQESAEMRNINNELKPVGLNDGYKTYSANSVYSLQNKKSGMGLSAGFNINSSTNSTSHILYTGPSLLYTMVLLNRKLSLSAGSVYNRIYTNSQLTADAFNHRINMNFKPVMKNNKSGKFTLGLNANLVQRFQITENHRVNDLTIFTNLNYNF